MEVDTGAAFSVVSENTHKSTLGNIQLRKSKILLKPTSVYTSLDIAQRPRPIRRTAGGTSSSSRSWRRTNTTGKELAEVYHGSPST